MRRGIAYMTLAALIITSVVTGCITKERCARRFPPTTVTVDSSRVTTVEVPRDSIIVLPPDSSWLEAMLECDSNYQVALAMLLESSEGKQAEKPRIIIRSNKLRVDCKCDSARIHAILKDREVKTERIVNTVKVPQPIEVKYIPGYMWFLGLTGALTWIVLLFMIIIRAFGSRFKIPHD
ncbi:MAG TPA: hypothetical protein P5531_10580 [Bacteroidales bacterium]|nr:hypothetical protein [Bacteroidales bacterium]HSA43592.1 hypothetical protein [Bacteroidales bacterium]